MSDERERYAAEVIKLARDFITLRFRFFDKALAMLEPESEPGLGGYVCDGRHLKYDPDKLLKDYLDEPAWAIRLFLHSIFHQVFLHPYRFDRENEHFWNLATDIAVEKVILDMEIPGTEMTRDTEEKIYISRMRKWTPDMTAEKLYREFLVGGISSESEEKYGLLFSMDRHPERTEYKDEPETVISEEDWKKIAERVKAELKSFSRNVSGEDSITLNLKEATRERIDYEALIARFAVMGEEIKVNPDEFDYIFYTYGLSRYKNLPLIEPLEYAEDKRIREFVIAIDTSASVRGEMVKRFVERTVSILERRDSFSGTVNIHIVQCDAAVTDARVIHSVSEAGEELKDFTIKGFGATDYRPVFEYINEKLENKEFTNLRGLIYFTDGYGIYPGEAPGYEVIFALAGVDEFRMKPPSWVTGVVIEDET